MTGAKIIVGTGYLCILALVAIGVIILAIDMTTFSSKASAVICFMFAMFIHYIIPKSMVDRCCEG